MSGPVGDGERKHGPNGNSTLITVDLEGHKVYTPLWMNAFATDLNLQIDSAQRRTGLSHRPIRITERMLMISTLWNILDRQKYVKLIATIREHWARNLNELRPTPMKLIYPGANKIWLGFIENASIGYAVTDVILNYQFQMRVVPQITQDVSKVLGRPAPYVPHRGDIIDFGPSWYAYNEYLQDLVGTGNEHSHGSSQGGHQLHTSGPGR